MYLLLLLLSLMIMLLSLKNINCWHLLKADSVKDTSSDSVRQMQKYILEMERERNSPRWLRWHNLVSFRANTQNLVSNVRSAVCIAQRFLWLSIPLGYNYEKYMHSTYVKIVKQKLQILRHQVFNTQITRKQSNVYKISIPLFS